MLARLSLLACGAVLLAAAPAIAKDKTKPTPIACEGIYGPESSEALLKQTFGAENVFTGKVDGPEGEELLATTVFPNEPRKTMQFSWWDEENRSQLAAVDLAADQVGPGGVQVGQTVAEVVALNGAPFTMSGFWWDYGGYANIDKGKLANLDENTCFLSIRFAPPDDYSQAIDVTPVSGDTQVPSDEGLLEVLDVRVQSVSVSWADPNGESQGDE